MFFNLLTICAATIWINQTQHPWNERDIKSYNRAVYVCANDDRYKDTPCLKKFIKTDKLSYRAICGTKE